MSDYRSVSIHYNHGLLADHILLPDPYVSSSKGS